MDQRAATTELGDDGPADPPFAATIPGMLAHVSTRYAGREAVVQGATRLTFAELERESAIMAKGLLARGITKGARIGIMMPNGADFAVLFLAAARIGATVVLLSTLYQPPELQWVLRHADIAMMLTVDRYLRHNYLDRLEISFPELRGQTAGQLALREAPFLRAILVWGGEPRSWSERGPQALAKAAEGRPELDDDFLGRIEASVLPADALCMIYTSGSTAEPKAVVHGHGPFVRHTYQMSHHFWDSVEGDRLLANRPFFWIGGLTNSLFFCLHTGRCLLVPDNLSGTAVRRMIETADANALSGDENWFRALAADPDLAEDYELYRVGLDVCAVARRTPQGPRHLNPLRGRPQHIHEDRFNRFFGMTETIGAHSAGRAGELLPEDRPRRCGKPVPGVEIEIVDVASGQPVSQGQQGELLIRGYAMMLGLYKRERSEVFDERGFYRTGDLCSLDDQGYIVFGSRLGNMIKVHGANVAPIEVESALMALPGVTRASVLGIDQAGEGTLLVAGVEYADIRQFDQERVRTDLQSVLSSFKVPRHIIGFAAGEMPLLASGKVHLGELGAVIRVRLDQTRPG